MIDERKISKQPPPASTASAEGPCPTLVQISLRILNGRFGKDAINGNFTCIAENSASVIDYFISEPELFDNISDLEIHERLESIHMPVRLELHFAAINRISGHTNNSDQGISENKRYSRYFFKSEIEQEYVKKSITAIRRHASEFCQPNRK